MQCGASYATTQLSLSSPLLQHPHNTRLSSHTRTTYTNTHPARPTPPPLGQYKRQPIRTPPVSHHLRPSPGLPYLAHPPLPALPARHTRHPRPETRGTLTPLPDRGVFLGSNLVPGPGWLAGCIHAVTRGKRYVIEKYPAVRYLVEVGLRDPRVDRF